MTRHTGSSKTSRGNRTLRNSSSYQEFICQHCQDMVRDSLCQIWQAHTDQARTSCSQKHQKTDLIEGQFQFSMMSHKKEGSV